MNCDLYATGEVHKSGRELLRCRRFWCSSKAILPLSGGIDKVHVSCIGWPRLFEFGFWISLLLASIGIRDFRGCGCKKRRDNLNAVGKHIHDAASRARGRVVTAIRGLFQATLKGYRWLLGLARG